MVQSLQIPLYNLPTNRIQRDPGFLLGVKATLPDWRTFSRQLARWSFMNCMVSFSWLFTDSDVFAPQIPMLPGTWQVPGKGQAVWKVGGSQRLGRPRGVDPTQISLACATLAKWHREVALTSETRPLRRELQWSEVTVPKALWEAEVGRSQSQEIETILANMVKPHLY
ncbi:hypothetical protein AAY473_033138 [Plecturocebus cupreus]